MHLPSSFLVWHLKCIMHPIKWCSVHPQITQCLIFLGFLVIIIALGLFTNWSGTALYKMSSVQSHIWAAIAFVLFLIPHETKSSSFTLVSRVDLEDWWTNPAVLKQEDKHYYAVVDLKGTCDRCGMANVEVVRSKSDKDKEMILCNQCRPEDGAYGY